MRSCRSNITFDSCEMVNNCRMRGSDCYMLTQWVAQWQSAVTDGYNPLLRITAVAGTSCSTLLSQIHDVILQSQAFNRSD